MVLGNALRFLSRRPSATKDLSVPSVATPASTELPAELPAYAPPWDVLRAHGLHDLADFLIHTAENGALTDVDQARISGALRQAMDQPQGFATAVATLSEQGVAAFLHPSGQRDLQGRTGAHLLGRKLVRLGRVTAEQRNPAGLRNQDFGLDIEMLRTSMLVVAPPGSGKTTSYAVPVVEHLCLQSLAGQASVVVIDPKGDDFRTPGWFDIDIDLGNPDGTWGFDLYGGADAPEEAADRLASALLPPGISADKAYFMDASKNALYQVLAPYHAANGLYPKLRQLLGLLRGDERSNQSIRDKLKKKGTLRDFEDLLEARATQAGQRADPAASLVERLGLLNRPTLVKILDEKPDTFRMDSINQPARIRLGLPEGKFPEAARILARLAIAQFVQVTSSPGTNTEIFKGLAIDEAGRYIDDYVARGVQRIRSKNAGLVLLTQSLGDFPEELRATVFGSVGCKAIFGGVDPTDAEYFAEYWGKHWVDEYTTSSSFGTADAAGNADPSISIGPTGTSVSLPGESRSEGLRRQSGTSVRQVEQYLWSSSEIINRVPAGHSLVSLALPNGVRVPPTLVNMRE